MLGIMTASCAGGGGTGISRLGSFLRPIHSIRGIYICELVKLRDYLAKLRGKIYSIGV